MNLLDRPFVPPRLSQQPEPCEVDRKHVAPDNVWGHKVQYNIIITFSN